MKSIKKLSLSVNLRADKAELDRVLSALEEIKFSREFVIADTQSMLSECEDEDYFPVLIRCKETLSELREEESYV